MLAVGPGLRRDDGAGGGAMRCMDAGVTACGALASPNATVQQLGDKPTKTVIPASVRRVELRHPRAGGDPVKSIVGQQIKARPMLAVGPGRHGGAMLAHGRRGDGVGECVSDVRRSG